MIIEKYKGISPTISKKAKIFKNAVIAGDVTIHDFVNIWYNVTVRGDMAPVTILKNTNRHVKYCNFNYIQNPAETN